MNPERRSDEPDAGVVSFQSRFPLQDLIFAHCPYQPPRPIRWNFLTKFDWLSLRRIADTECVILPIQIIANESPLRRGKHQLSVRHSDTHLGRHFTDISHARSVSVQETAVTVLLCRGQPSRGRHTGATSSSASTAYPGCLVALRFPSMNERDDIILEAMAEIPDLDDSPPSRWPGDPDTDYQLSPTQPIRDGTSYSSEIPCAVRANQHSA